MIVAYKRWVSMLIMSCLMIGCMVPAGLAEGVGIQINHTPSVANANQDYVVQASITGGVQGVTAAVYYSIDQQAQAPLAMVPIDASTYEAKIPGARLAGTQLDYYIEASEGESQPVHSTTYNVAIQPQPPVEESKELALLITELVPDTKNVNSVDGYEFVEVYNNTDATIDFNKYHFFYNGKDTWTTKESNIQIPARTPVVFWILNGSNENLQIKDFIQNFQPAADLVEGTNLFHVNGGGGMANTAARNLQIRSNEDKKVISSASYAKEHVAENMGIFYKHPEAGSTDMILLPTSGKTAATPGIISTDQVTPPIPEIQPEILHNPAQAVDAKDLEITATIKGLVPVNNKWPDVQLLYKTSSQSRYAITLMTKKSGDEFSGTIPADVLVEPKLDYKIRVKGSVESYSVNINLPAYDESKVPKLLVTEIVPNTTNVTGTSSDAYEFIEVYNNTDQPVNFKNYKVYYRYPDKGPSADVKWASTKADFILPAQQSAVFWIINEANSKLTAADFNTFYKTNLVLDQNLFIIKSDGMANSGSRAIVVKTNTEKEVSAAYYNNGIVYDGGEAGDETKEDKGIQYKYPVNGGNTMIKVSSGLNDPTPGKVDPALVPGTPIHVVPDTVSPTIKDVTGVTEVDQSKGLDLQAFADDDKQVTSVQVFIHSDKQQEYVGHNLKEDYNDKLYHYKLSSADLIGRDYIEYYFVVSDGTNDTQSEPVRVKIVGGPDQSPLRLNAKDGDILHGMFTLKGTAQQAGPDALQLRVDGQPAQDTFAALENDAYFVFDANNVDYYFKNAITMGPPEQKEKTILYTFMDPIESYTTLSFPIDASRLKIGSDNVIYIRAGSKSSPFDDRVEENKDDFEVKNVRLLLADGTEIWDAKYAERDKEIKMGDSAGKPEWIGFQFDLKPELFKSKAYAWNTKEAADGDHQVAVSHGSEEVLSKVTVDNTPPSIKATVEEGQVYRGQFTIDAEIKDAGSGVDQIEAMLDDQKIDLPYATSSGVLTGGAHVLSLKAADKVGNAASQVIHFEVPVENPNKPELIAPTLGQENVGINPNLTVKVTDPTQDPMKVSFYKGFNYDGNRVDGFNGFKNASDTEPPKEMVPQGEQALTAEEYQSISAIDGKYLVNDSVEQFPYQRYEITLDPSVQKSDRVDIAWKGNSLEGRKVSLYAWSPTAKKWEQLDHAIAGTDDFELKSTVKAGEYFMEQAEPVKKTIQIMVQDEIAPSKNKPEKDDPYDFSFVWMSDTQYYSQSYPEIYRKNVAWIAENKDNINLKYVIHTGDIVDKDYQEYQWQEADMDMKVLEDANIPYGVLAGNHDVGHQNNDYTNYWRFFGADRFEKMPTFAGSYDNNRGHYDLVSANGNDFIIVYMGWGLGDKEIDWMNEVVAKYPERKAILALHEYMLVSNNRAPIADKIFDKVVKPNKNVIAALSGHYHDAQLKVDALDDDGDGIPDRNVYQMLADYQGAEQGGLGYIRLMQFDMKNNKLHMKTYSPYLDDYNYYDPDQFPGKDEFSLDLDLQPKTKRVATDYIGVKVYTDQLIGQNQQVKSGDQTSVSWKGLKSDRYYQWYTKAEDDHSGSVLSDIWGFYTGAFTEPGRPDPENPTPQPSTPEPTKPVIPTVPTPATDKGIIQAEAGTDGSYAIDRATLEQAVKASENGKIEIRLKNASDAAKLVLDGPALQQVKERKLTIEVVASGVTVALPAASFPSSLTGADKVILNIDTTTNAAIQTAVKTVQQGNNAYTATGLVYTLSMVTIKDNKEASIHQWNGPVTITRTLTDEQRKNLDVEYAGVYYLDGNQAQYMGGKFDGRTVTFTTDHFSSFAVFEYHKQFADVTGTWAQAFIEKLAAKHIITGTDEHHYSPTQQVTRAELVTLAIRALGYEAAAKSTVFTDVSANAYYAGYVAQASELGLIQGHEGKFRPQDPITREEAAVILLKMMESMNKKASTSTSDTAFTDMKSVSDWATDAVNHLKSVGVINGKDDNRFDPRGAVTRAEIAKMIYMVQQQ
ncbi:S-layer homology domain-containing protein [Paenibacillus selenitireducens]|nr:S-layer homology domain-containing protein [Paenibacillus selenitireducens]